MMKTEMDVNVNEDLRRKAVNLLKAAYEFWEIHQKVCGSSAVVWLEDDNEKLVVFTRGEYRRQIMENIDQLKDQAPMEFDGPIKVE
jgi:hypothetical protein